MKTDAKPKYVIFLRGFVSPDRLTRLFFFYQVGSYLTLKKQTFLPLVTSITTGAHRQQMGGKDRCNNVGGGVFADAKLTHSRGLYNIQVSILSVIDWPQRSAVVLLSRRRLYLVKFIRHIL